MRKFMNILALSILVSFTVLAQQPTFQDTLLDHLTGKWVLQGTIAGRQTTHDITVEWVLGHQYVRLYELSREKDANGQTMYEAIVFIGWDQPAGQYACLWLDISSHSKMFKRLIYKKYRPNDCF